MDFKKFFSNKKRNIIFVIMAVMLLVDLVLGLICRIVISSLDDQTTAERWSDGDRAAMVSLFFTEDQTVTVDTIKKLEYTMEKKMQEAGIVSDDDDDNSKDKGSKKIVDTKPIGDKDGQNAEETLPQEPPKSYSSSYSAQGISTLEFENRKAENINTIGAGGDFFLFHPMELVSGGYFNGDDLMKDKVVVDEFLAWELFGSSDIVGQCVTISGVNHYIAGVVKSPTGRFNEAAGLSKSVVIISYDSLSKYGTILSGRTNEAEISEDGARMQIGGINCYEVVMPDPVDGIAARVVKESAGLDDKYIRVVDNTNRFSGFALFEVVKDFGIRSMWTQPIFYPYWENVARAWEDVVGVLFFIRIICKVVFWLIVAGLVITAYRHKSWTVRGIAVSIADRKYEFEARRRINKNPDDK